MRIAPHRTREEVIAAAERLVGTRYKFRGRDATECDCIGLIALVAGLARTPFDCVDYRAEFVVEGQLRAHVLRAGFTPVPWPDARPGDLVTFRGRNPAIERHMGILVEEGRFIHTTADLRRVSREVLEKKWARLLHAAYRFPGIPEPEPELTDG